VNKPRLKPGPKPKPQNNDSIVFRPYIKISARQHPELYRLMTSTPLAIDLNAVILAALGEHAKALSSGKTQRGSHVATMAEVHQPAGFDVSLDPEATYRPITPPSPVPEMNVLPAIVESLPVVTPLPMPQQPEVKPKSLTGFLARAKENAQ